MVSAVSQTVQREKELVKKIEERLKQGESVDSIAQALHTSLEKVQRIARQLKRL